MAASGVLLALGLAVSPASGEEAFELPKTTAAPRVDFSSDRFAYDQASGTVHLQGHVRVVESTWVIRSEEMWLDLEARRARGRGFIQMEDGVSLLFGDEGEYDFAAKEGKVLGAAAGFSPWRIRSRSAFIDSSRNYHFRRARFSSCNEDPAVHYYFRATGVHVFPRRWMYATNTVLFVGPVPVFYTPFWWKSLRKKHLLPTRFQPGYDRRNGMFARSTTLFDIRESLFLRLFADYYGAQGPGFGSELQFTGSESGHGALYGYRIREKHSGQDRWAVLGDHYQHFLSSHAVQMRLQTQSDSEFNNHYSRASALRVTPELINNAALVRSTGKTTTRLSYSRVDREDPGRRVYLKADESAPRLDWQTAGVRVPGLPLLNTFSFFADNRYSSGVAFLQKSAGLGWLGSTSVPILRGLSWSPSLRASDTYDNRRDVVMDSTTTRIYRDVFTARYGVGNNIRALSPVGVWDVGHSLGLRSRPGSAAVEKEAVDNGIETNLVTVANVLRPNRQVFVRLQTGYDLRRFRDRDIGFRERVQPFGGDVNWVPRRGVQISVVDHYQLQEGNRFFALQADLGDREGRLGREGRFISVGLSHNLAQKGHYLLNQEFAWQPSSGTWKAGGALRLDAFSPRGFKYEAVTAFEKELWLGKDFHDFETRVQFRIRPGGVKEVSFRINLRLEKDRPLRKSPQSPWSLWRTDDR